MAFSGVMTRDHAGACSAREVSIFAIRPLGIVLCSITACARFGIGNSAVNFAAPVTFSLPSTRESGSPTSDAHARPPARLKRPNHALLGQFDFERVLRIGARASYRALSAAASKDFDAHLAPTRAFSASSDRQGLCATPPSAIRALLIRLPSNSSAAATETSANA